MTARFVAIGVPLDVRTALERSLVAVRARWPEYAWTDPAGWHVTLAFLGELSPDRVPEVADVVARSLDAVRGAVVPRRLSLGAVDRFGERLLIVRVAAEPGDGVVALGESVQSGLETAALPVQRRVLQPHVTLARARRERPVTEEAVSAVTRELPRGASWPVRAIGVWSSHPGAGPARYEVDAEVALPS